MTELGDGLPVIEWLTVPYREDDVAGVERWTAPVAGRYEYRSGELRLAEDAEVGEERS